MAATFRPTRLAGPAVMPNAETVAYAGPGAGKITIVRSIRVANTSGAAITFGISLCAAGAGGVAANRIIPDGTSIPANGQYVDPEMHEVLETGDTLSWKASAAAGLTCTITGIVESL